jgi:hypothetical protein
MRGVGFLEGEATVLASEVEFKRRDGRTEMDTCVLNSSIFILNISSNQYIAG